MKLIGKDIKCIVITAFHKFNKLEEILDMLSVGLEGILKNKLNF